MGTFPHGSNSTIYSRSICTLPATVSLNHENRVPLAAVRPKCNSILHLFGEWLFEAANIGTEAWLQNSKSEFVVLEFFSF